MKRDQKADQAVLVDMNEDLISYAAGRLPHDADLAKTLVEATKSGLQGLDDLFKDNGVGRTENFLAIGEGYLVDRYELSGEELNQETEKFAHAALHLLATHEQQYDRWEK